MDQHRNWLLTALFSIAMTAGAQTTTDAIDRYLDAAQTRLGLTAKDLSDREVTSGSTDANGISYIYIRQTVNGLPVQDAVANFAVRDGRVVNFGDRLLRDVASRANTPTPTLDAKAAVVAAARELGLAVSDVRIAHRTSPTELLLGRCGISSDPIPARLLYQPVKGGEVRLAWDLTIRSTATDNWWHVAVDALTGKMLRKQDYTVHCTIPANAYAKEACAPPEPMAPPAMPPPGEASYKVFPLPLESPTYGPRSVVSEPSDATASPFGWHDIDGAPGAEYTITRGNNVHAGEDIDADDVIGYSPDGGPSLVFDFPFNPPQPPEEYLDAAITNLFYTCNVLHDIWFQYGFDEASGNFQYTNYTGEGFGFDDVQAQAQDGSGTNNANFGTPPDGSPGAMQMFLWRTSSNDTFFVNTPSAIAGDYPIELAGFGTILPSEPITTDLVLADDGVDPTSDGCEGIVNGSAISGKIAVVDRGQCTFVSKVLALEAAGALAVIVVNNVDGAPITMGGVGGEDISIPAVMISMADGQLLKDAMLQGPVNASLHGAGSENLLDCDFDNGIIAHEYGHGISNRLTGGPANTDCLNNEEQMGEGWSDWMALALTMHAGDLAENARGMGNFVEDEGPDGIGLRPAPYTTNMAVNPYTYAITNTAQFAETHALGFVWATMLWDLTWDLVDVAGFDPDLYNGTGGNNIAMHLVMDGMKLQPCSPGFVDGRNAILLADSLNYGAEHACLIWNAFARRGLGYSASQGSSFSVSDQVEAFDLPALCSGLGLPAVDRERGFTLMPNPASGNVTLSLGSPLTSDAMVRLLTVDGRVRSQQWFPTGTVQLAMDLHGVASGVYLIQLEADGERMQRRLVVE